MNNKLDINEVYGPVKQGEGRSLGMDCLFLRMARCNLACIWCDTPYTWNWIGTKFQHPEKFDPTKEIHSLETVDVFNKIMNLAQGSAIARTFGTPEKFQFPIRSVVLSGGEPMLQQKKLIPLLIMLKGVGFWIEVETNGTIFPLPEFIELVDQFNCSPKLTNSGEDNKRSMIWKRDVLTRYASLSKTIFKFVVSEEKDVRQIRALVTIFKMASVYLMPEGSTKERYHENEGWVKKLVEQNPSFHFSPRLHVIEHGNKRGV